MDWISLSKISKDGRCNKQLQTKFGLEIEIRIKYTTDTFYIVGKKHCRCCTCWKYKHCRCCNDKNTTYQTSASRHPISSHIFFVTKYCVFQNTVFFSLLVLIFYKKLAHIDTLPINLLFWPVFVSNRS